MLPVESKSALSLSPNFSALNTVLIVDDEEKIRTLLAKIIQLEGFQTLQAADGKAALHKLASAAVDVVVCDVKLPDIGGVELVKVIRQKYPVTEVILLTAYGNISDGVQAIKNGAFDYITKGDDNNKIIPLLYKASEKVMLSRRLLQLESKLNERHSFDNILGKSDLIKAAIEAGRKVAKTDATVLLTGETGTGKEVFAEAIHYGSERSKANYIAVNCSAFSKDLLENELFGHKAGAFTGALKDAKGIFEEADNGTVFLDEIGEMPLDLQAKLLRILESGSFLKVGDNKPTKVNVRIVAATNRKLREEVKSGHFREDLFYRIAVFQIDLPALRDRIADIEELSYHFLVRFNNKAKKKITKISREYLDTLRQHPFKGNIRELRNIIERSVILTEDDTLEADSLPAELKNGTTGDLAPEPLSAFDLASAEKHHIIKVLNYTNGNKAETARLLNIALTTLYRKITEYKLG